MHDLILSPCGYSGIRLSDLFYRMNIKPGFPVEKLFLSGNVLWREIPEPWAGMNRENVKTPSTILTYIRSRNLPEDTPLRPEKPDEIHRLAKKAG